MAGTIKKSSMPLATRPEYQSRFGGLPNNQLVNNIYVQLFNRDAEEAGLNWVPQRVSWRRAE